MGNFSNTNFEDWTKFVNCPSSPCTLNISYSLYDSSSSIIYSNINYDYTMLFFGLNSSDGSLSTSMYTTGSVTQCYQGGSITKVGSSLFLFFDCSQAQLFKYDISSGTFTESYSFSQTNVTTYDAYITSSYTYLCGKSVNILSSAFYFRGLTSKLNETQGISTAVVSMSVISSGDNYYIASTYTSSRTPSVTSPTATNSLAGTSSITHTNTTSYSDVAFYETDITISNVTGDTNHSESLLLTCSRSGTTNFSYSFTYANNSAGPSWVTVDDVNQEIDIVAPNVTVSTSYSLILVANSSSESSSRNIYITVEPSNATTSTNTTSNTTNSSSEDDASTKKMAETITSIAFSTVVVCIIFTAIISGGSFTLLWIVFTQFQYYLMLPLLGAHIPLQHINFVSEYKFVLLNFKFFDMPNFINDFSLYDTYTQFFD